MPQSFEDKLREEHAVWIESRLLSVSSGNFFDMKKEASDWWLSKFSEYKSSLKEEIEGKNKSIESLVRSAVVDERKRIFTDAAKCFHPYCGDPSCFEKLRKILKG